MLRLQRRIGNRATTRLLREPLDEVADVAQERARFDAPSARTSSAWPSTPSGSRTRSRRGHHDGLAGRQGHAEVDPGGARREPVAAAVPARGSSPARPSPTDVHDHSDEDDFNQPREGSTWATSDADEQGPARCGATGKIGGFFDRSDQRGPRPLAHEVRPRAPRGDAQGRPPRLPCLLERVHQRGRDAVLHRHAAAGSRGSPRSRTTTYGPSSRARRSSWRPRAGRWSRPPTSRTTRHCARRRCGSSSSTGVGSTRESGRRGSARGCRARCRHAVRRPRQGLGDRRRHQRARRQDRRARGGAARGVARGGRDRGRVPLRRAAPAPDRRRVGLAARRAAAGRDRLALGDRRRRCLCRDRIAVRVRLAGGAPRVIGRAVRPRDRAASRRSCARCCPVACARARSRA